MSLITYVPAEGYDPSEQGVINTSGGTFDIGAALASGGGQITVDDSVSPILISALDSSPGLRRSNVIPGSPVEQDIIAPVLAHSKGAQAGDLLQRGPDGIFSGIGSTGPPGEPGPPGPPGSWFGAVTQQADDYTLTLADIGTLIRCTKATANTITVPANADVALAVGDTVTIEQAGAGAVHIAPAAGVTIDALSGNAHTAGQNAVVMLVKVATDEWLLYGDLTA